MEAVYVYYLFLSFLLKVSSGGPMSDSVPSDEVAPHDIYFKIAHGIRSFFLPVRRNRRTTPESILILGQNPDIPTTPSSPEHIATESGLSMSETLALLSVFTLPAVIEGSGHSDNAADNYGRHLIYEFGSGMSEDETGSGSFISFPGLATSRPPVTKVETLDRLDDSNCSISNAFIYFRGVCHTLLKQAPCQEGYWLILNNDGIPGCALRPCPPGQLFFRDKCVNVTDTSVCGPFEILFLDYAGRVSCDCQPDYIYDNGMHRCFAEHQRGSCDFSYHLQFDSEDHVQCVYNPCKRDDLVQNPQTHVCYLKMYSGSCVRKKELGIRFIEKDRSAICYSVSNRNIFEVPALSSCPRGSKRSYLGSCQAVLRFGNPFSYSVPSQHTSRYSVCPRQYTKYPDGSCKLLNSLIGR